jgi:hypothetical protein
VKNASISKAVSSRGICFKPKNVACQGFIARSGNAAQYLLRNREQQLIDLLGEIPGRRYNYREILPGVIALKSSAPQFEVCPYRRPFPVENAVHAGIPKRSVGRAFLSEGKAARDLPGNIFRNGTSVTSRPSRTTGVVKVMDGTSRKAASVRSNTVLGTRHCA